MSELWSWPTALRDVDSQAETQLPAEAVYSGLPAQVRCRCRQSKHYLLFRPPHSGGGHKTAALREGCSKKPLSSDAARVQNAASAEAQTFQSTDHLLSVSEGGHARRRALGRIRSLAGKEAAHPSYPSKLQVNACVVPHGVRRGGLCGRSMIERTSRAGNARYFMSPFATSQSFA